MAEEKTGNARFLLRNGEAKAPKESTSAKDTQRSVTADAVRRPQTHQLCDPTARLLAVLVAKSL